MLYPMLSRSYLAVLRARSASLLRRTRRRASALTPATITPWSHLLTDASASTLTEPSSPWTEEYWALLEEAESTLASAQPALMRSSLRPSERLTTIGLKIGVIIALTAEAELYHLAPPVHAESRQQCLSTILKVVGIGKTFSALDYEMVDPFLGVRVMSYLHPSTAADICAGMLGLGDAHCVCREFTSHRRAQQGQLVDRA